MQTPSPPVIPPRNPPTNRAPKPQQQIHQIHPNRPFHPTHARIPLRILPNIQVPKDPKHHDPQKEQQDIPRRAQAFRDHGDHVDNGCSGTEGTDRGRERPFGIGVFVLEVRFPEILCVQADYGDGEDELEGAVEEVED